MHHTHAQPCCTPIGFTGNVEGAKLLVTVALAPHTDCCLVVRDRHCWLKQSRLLSLANHPGAGHFCPAEENGFQSLCV